MLAQYLGCPNIHILLSVWLFTGPKISISDHLDLKGELLCKGQPVPGVFIEAYDHGEFIIWRQSFED